MVRATTLHLETWDITSTFLISNISLEIMFNCLHDVLMAKQNNKEQKKKKSTDDVFQWQVQVLFDD